MNKLTLEDQMLKFTQEPDSERHHTHVHCEAPSPTLLDVKLVEGAAGVF